MLMAMKRDEWPTAADARRVNRLVARAVALEIVRGGSCKLAQLDADLMPTDRVMQRWAVSVGLGLPTGEWDDAPKAKPPPLDDETATVVDQIIIRGPPRYAQFARRWYKTPIPSLALAEQLGVSRAGLYLEWRCMLFHYKREFEASQHEPLLSILRATF